MTKWGSTEIDTNTSSLEMTPRDRMFNPYLLLSRSTELPAGREQMLTPTRRGPAPQGPGEYTGVPRAQSPLPRAEGKDRGLPVAPEGPSGPTSGCPILTGCVFQGISGALDVPFW